MISLLTAAALAANPAASAPIYHYVRSNRDGSEAENIVHYRPSPTDVAVYKWVSKCTAAAYVTAQMDPSRWEPSGLDAGKVGKDGEQVKFGRVSLDPATRTLTAKAELPIGTVEDTTVVPQGTRWFLYDYDFGDLNAMLQEMKPKRDFRFALALIWPGAEDFFTTMGTVEASYRGKEMRLDRAVRRFDLKLTGANPATGTLWTELSTGAIVEAEMTVPNHPEYRDFRLKLAKVQPGGQPAWDALTNSQYANCPAT